MPRYCVDICRTTYRTRLFEVDAESDEEAESKALQAAYDYDWSGLTDGSDYEIEDIKEDR